MRELKVKIQLLSPRARLPAYATEGAAALDVFAVLSAPLELKPGARGKIGTGFALEIPAGYEAQVRPRSGLALERGLTVLNAPGTIDRDYRGEIAVILINLGEKSEIINDGDKIAQIVFAPVLNVSFEKKDVLTATVRAEGGFGSTGR